MSLEIENNEIPLVSICCLTYNHELYIRQALDSFLMQETNFSFEVVIHDDASTDNTANIIREYAEKYPAIFKPLLQTENQRSKLGGGMNPRFNYPRARGKYIALCEGDDYWTNPLKLQKQVDFLEKNKDCSFVFHKARKYNNNRKMFLDSYPQDVYRSINNVNDFFNISAVPTCSVVFLNSVDFVSFNHSHGDFALYCTLMSSGNAGFLNEEMSVYRLNDGGVSKNYNTHSYLKRRIKELEIEINYKKFSTEVKNQIRGVYLYQITKLLNGNCDKLTFKEKKYYFFVLFSEIFNWKRLGISYKKAFKIFFRCLYRSLN